MKVVFNLLRVNQWLKNMFIFAAAFFGGALFTDHNISSLAEIVAVNFMIGLGNNTGRYFYMSIPLVIYFLCREAQPLLDGSRSSEKIPSWHSCFSILTVR